MNRYDVYRLQPMHNGKLKELEFPKGSYYVWVPLIATYTQEELDTIGVPVADSIRYELSDTVANINYRENQSTNLNQLILVKWSLNEMVEAFVNGYRIAFEKRSDVVKLNDVIDEYFDYIDSLIANNEIRFYNVEDRLKHLDEFNKSIFNNNKAQIRGKRARIIKEASISNFLPEIIRKEIVDIDPNSLNKVKVTNNTGLPISKYTVFDSNNNVIDESRKDNPLAPVYKDQPVIDFNNMNYESRFQSPEERRLYNEHLRAKQILKDKQ